MTLLILTVSHHQKMLIEILMHLITVRSTQMVQLFLEMHLVAMLFDLMNSSSVLVFLS